MRICTTAGETAFTMLTKRCCSELGSSADATGTLEIRSPADAALPQPTARAANRATKKGYGHLLIAQAIKLDTARCSVAACWSHTAVAAAATTTALELGPDTRQAISR